MIGTGAHGYFGENADGMGVLLAENDQRDFYKYVKDTVRMGGKKSDK